MQNISNADRSPRFILEFDMNSGDLKINKNQYIYPKPMEVRRGELTLFVFGSPIINHLINKNRICNDIVNKSALDKDYLKKIDGEFLFILVNKKNKTLEVANDRYS